MDGPSYGIDPPDVAPRRRPPYFIRMRVITVPCRRDNFTYLVGADTATNVAVVDPCDGEPVLDALTSHGLSAVAILNTHHHGDHVGGNLELLAAFPGIPVYAHRSDRARIPGISHALDDGDELDAAGLHFRVLFVPGHTSGHIAYATPGAVFVGDTLFGAGCGRLREGTPEEMYRSLTRLAQLPDETLVYFAHEYTLSNLRFAVHVEPANVALAERLFDAERARDAGRWTTPSTIELERRTNPFLRSGEPALAHHFAAELGPHPTPLQVFTATRHAKDHFLT